MTTSVEAATPEVWDRDLVEVADRRRPGRKEVSPALVHLLRHAAEGGAVLTPESDASAPGPIAADRADQEDGCAPVRGILFGLALSIPLWAAIGAAVRWAFG